MLEAAQATVPLTPGEEQKIPLPSQDWSDDFALKIVVQDFQRAEAFRTMNHDARWRAHDMLYEAWNQQLYWEGTNVPRSSVPVFLAFEQIESILPKLLSAIFADNPWFLADPMPGTSAEEARAARDLVLAQMDQARAREVFRRWLKSGLIYGNGIMELSWLQRETKRKRYHAHYEPRPDAMGAFAGFERVMDLRTITEIENRPELKWCSIKDIYVDPNCPSPSPQEARYIIKRVLADVDAIDRLRANEEFSIPSREILHEMARHKSQAQGDITKMAGETARGGNWNPSIDQTADPGGKRLEMLCYWSEDRCVYVLDRRHCAYNHANPYGFVPFYNFPYADMLDRFYAMGICDVLEGEQHLQFSIQNARIDELALNIHRPMVKRRGLPVPNYMLRQRPGQVLEADNPKEDFFFPEMPNVTSQAFIEIQASENRAQKVTGVTDLAVLGTPSTGGNSASRTATGVGIQAQASTSRLQYLVENAESLGIEPMLNHVWWLNQLYPPLGGITVKGEQGQYNLSPDVIINSNVKFAMRASAKMQSKMALLQVFPLVFQSLSNPLFMQQLSSQGLTINFIELMNMLLDTTGYRLRADLIRKLTPEEQQKQQQPPAEAMLRMQMQRERLKGEAERQQQKLTADREMADEDRQAEMMKAILPHALTSLGEEESS